MKTRILIILHSDFEQDSRVKKILHSLSAENAVYLLANAAKEKHQNFFTVNFAFRRILFPGFSFVYFLMRFFFKLFTLLCKMEFDVIYCNDLITLPFGVFSKIFFSQLKIVYDAHEYESNQIPNQSKFSIALHRLFEGVLINFADKVITVSDSIAEAYRIMYRIQKPELVLNCPHMTQVFKQDLFREKFGLRKDQVIFLYQGGFYNGRGIDVILKAFSKLQSDENVVVFMGYGPLESDIVSASYISNNIYFQPAVSSEILLKYTSSADFGILFYEDNCLNHRYCSPNKIFEYFMAGIPVIVSNLFEMSRLVRAHNVGVIAQSNTPDCLIEAVRAVRNYPYSLYAKNVAKVREKYSWEMQELVLKSVILSIKTKV